MSTGNARNPTLSPEVVELAKQAWLLASIEQLMNRFAAETTVYPGHMGLTTLGRERATNPFLRELAANQ